MTNPKLPRGYLLRSRKRLKAIALLLDEEAFADVVRESQDVVELLLTAVRRSFGIAVPFTLAWLAAQPYVDPRRIGTYGFSYPGMAQLLLASRPGTPVRALAPGFCGSGMYATAFTASTRSTSPPCTSGGGTTAS